MARGQRDPVRERRSRERRAHWQSSGLTIRDFCLRHGLMESAFHSWRRELLSRDGQSTSPPLLATPVAAAVRAGEGIFRIELSNNYRAAARSSCCVERPARLHFFLSHADHN